MSASSRTLLSVAAFHVALCSVSSARANEPLREQCIDSHEQAQKQRMDGKLRASQESLRFCSSVVCPDSVRDECTKLFRELERLLPSVVFEVKDGSGKALNKVRVTIDGQPFTEKLDGTALPVDPGEHTFTFEVADQQLVVQKLVFREGDHHHERVTMGASNLGSPESPRGGGQRLVGIAVGVTGIVGLGVGGLLGGLASSRWSSSKTNCASATNCPDRPQALEDHDSALSLATGSTVAVIAGGVLLATGIVVFLTAPKGTSRTAASASVAVVPSMDPGGGGMTVVGRF